MGCFDKIKVCELVESSILHQLSQLFDHHSLGLFGDDDLTMLKDLSGPETQRVEKKVVKVFKVCGLKITIKSTFNLVYNHAEKTN